MRVTVYKTTGSRTEIDLVHEILERDEDVTITYTDMDKMIYISLVIRKTEITQITARLD